MSPNREYLLLPNNMHGLLLSNNTFSFCMCLRSIVNRTPVGRLPKRKKQHKTKPYATDVEAAEGIETE